MQTINIRGIRLYAYHGCMEEEAIIGGDYIVNVQLKGDFSAAAKSDNLNETADYVLVYKIVKEEMAIRSKLIEHVAERIAVAAPGGRDYGQHRDQVSLRGLDRFDDQGQR